MTRQTNPTFKPALELWFRFYQDRTGETYIMDAKSGNHLKQLLKKLEAAMKAKGYDPTPEQILNALAVLLMSIQDKWILSNLEIAIVNSKFNVIISQARKNSPVVSAQRIDELVASRGHFKRTG